LGQWAELQSPAGPIGKTNDLLPAVPGGPEGVVEASPAFFSGLAEISRRAAKAFRQAGADADCEKRWTDFAAVCQRLAELAAKQAGAIELTATDRAWIRNYGRTLAKFHFDNDDTSDFPIISRVGSDPTAKSATYAWVAPPQALYVILPYRGRLRLFCGAVLSYRESVRDVGSVVPTNEPPAPPEFTETFRAEKTVGDLLADLLDETSGHDSPGDQQATVQQLEARLTDADVPALIQALSANLEQPANGPSPVAELIAKMNWGPFQVALLRLVETNEAAAQPVASILAQQPGDIDVGWICANFDRQSPMARAMFCFLLGQHGSAPPSAAVLDRAAGDADENVRWSAVMALRALQLTNDQGVAALSGCLGDANEFVAAAAARTLAMWGATNAAPALLANLQTRLASARAFTNGWRNQSDLFRRLSWISGDAGAMEERSALLDGQRFPDFAGSLLASPAVNAMAQAMGELRYMPAVEPLFAMLDGDCGLAAARALDQLAPDLLRGKLMDTACDPRRDPEDRDRALQLLLQTAPSKSEARRLEPLLDEGAEVSVKSPRGPAMGRMGWRLSDRAVQVIAHLLDKPPVRLRLLRPNDPGPAEARQWLKDAN
jgi:HEAT repeat protein